jgi:3',5'-nucleoside bisphosphate phosphatase
VIAESPSAGGSLTTSFVDLHAHSTASDGSRNPADVVREAKRLGLAAIALTDHDTVNGAAEALHAGAEVGIRVVVGVELSAVEHDVEIHVLGLHLTDVAALEDRLAVLRDLRRERARRIVNRLNDLGVRIDLAAVLEQAGTGAVGRPHVARAMVAEGWATDLRDAFDRYLGDGRPAYMAKERLSLADAIGFIHAARGLAILAHPGPFATKDRLTAFVPLGLDGVEVRHPSHPSDEMGRLLQLVDHFGLLPSGGSDWHGTAEGGRQLGMMRVPADWLGRHDDALSRRGKKRP